MRVWHQAAVGVAQHQQCIRLFFLKHRIHGSDALPYCLSSVIACRIQIIVRLPQLQILKKDLVKFIIIILTCVHKHMVYSRTLIQLP